MSVRSSPEEKPTRLRLSFWWAMSWPHPVWMSFFYCPQLMSFGGLWLGVCLSILVFVCICIRRDAYLSLQENAKEFNIMGIVISILNLVPGFLSLYKKQPFLVNNSISYHYINLMVGILFLLITLLFDLKLIYDKRAEE